MVTASQFKCDFYYGMKQSLLVLGKTQGILFALVVNSLILETQEIVIFGEKILNESKSITHLNLLQISKIGTGKTSSWTGKTQRICK